MSGSAKDRQARLMADALQLHMIEGLRPLRAAEELERDDEATVRCLLERALRDDEA